MRSFCAAAFSRWFSRGARKSIVTVRIWAVGACPLWCPSMFWQRGRVRWGWLGGAAMYIDHRFRDRAEAGRELARALMSYGGRPNVGVLALPRGGVPVGDE